MSSKWVIALVVPKRQTLKQILDTDLLKTVWRLVTWNPTKGAEPFQWWPDAFWLWLWLWGCLNCHFFVNIIVSWKEQLSLSCLPCLVARHLSLFDKSKSREREVPEASGFQSNCQVVAGYEQRLFRQTVFLFGATLSLVIVLLVLC